MSLYLFFSNLTETYIHKVQKSIPTLISKLTLIDTFLTLEQGMNYWMLPGKSSSWRAGMPWANGLLLI